MAEQKFEAALIRLEEIVNDLERGDAELEEALKLFEEGIGLIRLCDGQLKEAEQKLEQLKSEGELE